MKRGKTIERGRTRVEFGDFQTPPVLANGISALLARLDVSPRSVVEPTCGVGTLLFAALSTFPTLQTALGVDVSEKYLRFAETVVGLSPSDVTINLVRGNFFKLDWQSMLADLPEPILALGNPPWVTNATLGAIAGSNLPEKSNFQNHIGLDALTGKSNFDISEWILIRLLELLAGRDAVLAMLCKTAVARRVLTHAWKNELPVNGARLHRFDSQRHFGAAVDACLFVAQCTTVENHRVGECDVFDSLEATSPSSTFGLRSGRLASDIASFDALTRLQGDSAYRWRSGIKHDCSKVMTFLREGEKYRNGFGQLISLEHDCLFPMLRSSDVANDAQERSQWMLVTQTRPNDDTSLIKNRCPKTWAYLEDNAAKLQARGSAIYRNRPPFAIFGVGEYSFAPHKVAISGLYKRLSFVHVAPTDGKPTVLDDTCYFLDCTTDDEAKLLVDILNSPLAQTFYSSLIFWDAKRPITVEVLGQLNIEALAREIGFGDAIASYVDARRPGTCQHTLF